MLFLLYRNTDDGVFDNFPKISENFLKLVRSLRSHERCRIFSEDYRRLLKTLEEDPNMFRTYANEFKYNLRDKLDINEIIDIFTSEDMENAPKYTCEFLRVVYFPVKHSCLYNKSWFATIPERSK